MKQILYIFLFLATSAPAQFAWRFQDRDFAAGDTVSADCWVSGFDNVGAFQFSLAYDTATLAIRMDTPFTFTGLIPWTTDEFSHGLQPGCASAANEIRLVWADPYVFTYPNGKVFSIWFKAKKAGSVCGSIWALAGPLWPEAWDGNLINPVEMSVGCTPIRRRKMQAVDRQERAFSITPNPASGQVVVTLPAPGRVRIFDAAGRLESETDGAEGPNEITLTGAAGLKVVQYGDQTKKIMKQ